MQRRRRCRLNDTLEQLVVFKERRQGKKRGRARLVMSLHDQRGQIWNFARGLLV
jgi:hypothetical protein